MKQILVSAVLGALTLACGPSSSQVATAPSPEPTPTSITITAPTPTASPQPLAGIQEYDMFTARNAIIFALPNNRVALITAAKDILCPNASLTFGPDLISFWIAPVDPKDRTFVVKSSKETVNGSVETEVATLNVSNRLLQVKSASNQAVDCPPLADVSYRLTRKGNGTDGIVQEYISLASQTRFKRGDGSVTVRGVVPEEAQSTLEREFGVAFRPGTDTGY